uniref:Uncharacterized protein n=1 Tax=Podoviridae sp. ct8Lf7 TaxID=2827723 RepID=A0A8S5S0W9_9CAUD|nr:MAG TPA: hypothetical protein [Podoviridae sp. ct8Lf7]
MYLASLSSPSLFTYLILLLNVILSTESNKSESQLNFCFT